MPPLLPVVYENCNDSVHFSIPGTPKPLIRHSRSKIKEGPSVTERFKTQPVTVEAVNEAAKQGLSLAQSKSTANVLDRDEDGKR